MFCTFFQARRKVRKHMFISANNAMSATAHQIAELCEWRGERAYRPNQANNFNEDESVVCMLIFCTLCE